MAPGVKTELLPILTGPTAVGKTEVSIAVAQALDAEIISADSMQVYRRMEAGTAKPSLAQRAAVPHHLVDVVDPTEPFTVSDYRERAQAAIADIRSRGKLPLLVGGTRLYLKALTAPFVSGPEPEPAFREELASIPSEELHTRLAGVDPVTAARLHPNDRKRITRALEVFHTTGRPISDFQEESRVQGGCFEPVWVALVREREELYERVNLRVDEIMAAGLVEEVQGFLDEGLGPETPAMQGHGYKEIMRAILGDYPLEEGIRLLKRNTRHYVKYQLGWLRQEPEVHYVRADQPTGTAAAEVVAVLRRELASSGV